MTARWAGDFHRRIRCNAAVERTIHHAAPTVVAVGNFNDCQAMGHLALVDVVIRFRNAAFPDHFAVGVFVVHHDKRVLIVLKDFHAIDVIAERDRLRRRSAARFVVEGNTNGCQWIAPFGDNLKAVARRHDYIICSACCDLLKGEPG